MTALAEVRRYKGPILPVGTSPGATNNRIMYKSDVRHRGFVPFADLIRCCGQGRETLAFVQNLDAGVFS
jgi:hypothetical protein